MNPNSYCNLLMTVMVFLMVVHSNSVAIKTIRKHRKSSSLIRFPTSNRLNFCGHSWAHAGGCHAGCPAGVDSECPSGQRCFADISCEGSGSGTPGSPDSPHGNLYCGTSWTHASVCHASCPSGVDSECLPGQQCYADVDCSGSGSTHPPTTGPPATTSNTDSTTADFVGYYELTWTISTPLSGANAGIAFSGWVDISRALADSSPKYDTLHGLKYLSLGGGNHNGRWTAAALESVDAAIFSSGLVGYDGICYDIEEGDPGLSARFEASFSAAKAYGLRVLVTVSHSAPYGIEDKVQVMDTVLASTNVDYVSPQLYTTGTETVNDYTALGYGWDRYTGRGSKIVVSITDSSLYAHAVTTLNGFGVPLSGYIVWP